MEPLSCSKTDIVEFVLRKPDGSKETRYPITREALRGKVISLDGLVESLKEEDYKVAKFVIEFLVEENEECSFYSRKLIEIGTKYRIPGIVALSVERMVLEKLRDLSLSACIDRPGEMINPYIPVIRYNAEGTYFAIQERNGRECLVKYHCHSSLGECDTLIAKGELTRTSTPSIGEVLTSVKVCFENTVHERLLREGCKREEKRKFSEFAFLHHQHEDDRNLIEMLEGMIQPNAYIPDIQYNKAGTFFGIQERHGREYLVKHHPHPSWGECKTLIEKGELTLTSTPSIGDVYTSLNLCMESLWQELEFRKGCTEADGRKFYEFSFLQHQNATDAEIGRLLNEILNPPASEPKSE
ncbi:MAG: hypothetical protein K940chlam3_01532 [Chlamydiae bacterium]|nr:hypothetical protein [Chlamydiota bacterium]